MPTYAFKCPKCGNTEEDVRPISQCNRKMPCPRCGLRMNRDMAAEQGAGGRNKEWATGNISVSMAVPRAKAGEVQAELNAIPGCSGVEVTERGFIKTFSQKQKDAVAKYFGFHDKNAYY